MAKQGYFITFEGTEGSGKTTIMELVKDYFNNAGIDYVATREPGGSKIAEEIRDIILNTNNEELSYSAEALLYAASRAQHFDEIIRPALKAGKIVLCDRFLDSSLVYQGIARNLGVNEVYEINRFAIKDYLPNVTFFFDVSPEIGLRRINKDHNREVNRLDLEGLSFHQKVYDGYHQIIAKYQSRFKIIDASKSIDDVYRQIVKELKELI